MGNKARYATVSGAIVETTTDRDTREVTVHRDGEVVGTVAAQWEYVTNTTLWVASTDGMRFATAWRAAAHVAGETVTGRISATFAVKGE